MFCVSLHRIYRGFMEDISIEKTADGWDTLYVPSLDEHYHSIKGALAESRHIFIDCALRFHEADKVKVLEVGFGTGLNVLLTALDTSKRHVDYCTLELYPLRLEDAMKLNYGNMLGDDNAKQLFHDLHAARWNEAVELSPRFTLHKMLVDFMNPEVNLPADVDVCYMDAFAPEKQPGMWGETALKRLYDCMAQGGVLTTYCAKGEIRRRLQAMGFKVERLPGPPGGKREILRAVKD